MNNYQHYQLLQRIALDLGTLVKDPKALEKSIKEATALHDVEAAQAVEARASIKKNQEILAGIEAQTQALKLAGEEIEMKKENHATEVRRYLAEKTAFLQSKTQFETSLDARKSEVAEQERLNKLAKEELATAKNNLADGWKNLEQEKQALASKQKAISDYQESITQHAAKLAG